MRMRARVHFTGTCVHVLSGHTGCVRALEWSLGSGQLATGSTDASLRVWDALSAQLLITMEGLKGHWISALAWSPDNTQLATGSVYGTVRRLASGSAEGGMFYTWARLRACVSV